ncbi:CLUMA_CG005622, isoform A [Clunio marinus]|uniref:CLUMA_CG005622, isoform A n=1 Tax=Clunio marinus TaxID=568069 RepID=A0A1J1HWZ2_9DIPT|nr:CLUMA_CG005622, isoform A [Clunio marinus]
MSNRNQMTVARHMTALYVVMTINQSVLCSWKNEENRNISPEKLSKFMSDLTFVENSTENVSTCIELDIFTSLCYLNAGVGETKLQILEVENGMFSHIRLTSSQVESQDFSMVLFPPSEPFDLTAELLLSHYEITRTLKISKTKTICFPLGKVEHRRENLGDWDWQKKNSSTTNKSVNTFMHFLRQHVLVNSFTKVTLIHAHTLI